MTTTPAAPAHAAYLRHPDVHGDTVTFTAANDVWIAPLTGGRAWRLTDEGAPVGYPRFSPDGAHVAYTSRASGGPEIWLVSADGSTAPRRLTTDRKSTRLNSSHVATSYAVLCTKKKHRPTSSSNKTNNTTSKHT